MTNSEMNVTIKLKLQLAEGIHLNTDAPNSWTIFSEGKTLKEMLSKDGLKVKGDLSGETLQTLTSIPVINTTEELCILLDLYVCEDSGTCRMDKKTLRDVIQPLETVKTFILELN
ncbi:hypothetical protein ACF0H5_008933 [Mactra antiquata]